MNGHLTQVSRNTIVFKQPVSSPHIRTHSYRTMGPDFSPENCGHCRNSAVVPKLKSLDPQGKS